MEDADAFYKRIKRLAQQNKITLLELCVMVDLNTGTFQTARKEHRFLKADTVAQMAKILGVSVDYLVAGQEHGTQLNDKQESLWQMICVLEGEALTDVTNKITRLYLKDQAEMKAKKKPPLMKSEE
jgi:transcriptional regulator with XRE-family HTH domain